MRALLFSLTLLLSSTLTAAPGDYWHVDQWSTNVRLGPGTDYGIARQLGEGDVVMEIDRMDDWLYVVLDRNGNTGWLYHTLASPLSGTGTGVTPTEWYALFKELLRHDAGEEHKDDRPALFLDSRYLGHATVKVTVSEDFLTLCRDTQTEQLDALIRLWDTIDNTGIPGSIILADQDGTRLVVSSGLRGRHWLPGEPAKP